MTQQIELFYDFRSPPRDAWSFLAEVRPFHEPW